jgi:hypothetical protein
MVTQGDRATVVQQQVEVVPNAEGAVLAQRTVAQLVIGQHLAAESDHDLACLDG